jgi:hypothetical protein
MRKMLAILLVLTPLVLTLNLKMQAQYTRGEPAVGNSAGVLVSDGLFLDASEFTGAPDACTQILNAWLALPGSSGTIDARSLTGTLTCSTNPFSSSKHGKLLLGNATFQTTVPWVVPTRVQVEGLGATFDSSASVTFNTIILASASSVSPIVTMGNQNPSFGVQIKGLTIDCNNYLSCIGIYNGVSEEGSIIDNVNIVDAPAIGIRVTTNATSGSGAANSGPYRNIGVGYNSTVCTNCNGSTVALQVDGAGTGQVIREFDDVTVSGNGVSNTQWAGTAIGVYVYGVSTALTNSHAEFFPVGIQIGQVAGVTPAYSTQAVEVSNVSIQNVGGWNVILGNSGNNPATGDVTLEGITSGSANNQIVENNITAHNLTSVDDKYIGLYAVGHCPSAGCTGSQPAVFSTSNNVNWRAADGITKPSGSFSIDHPLDPANEFLNHSFVESPDMMNIYNGSVITNKRGLATVMLPAYFEALNQDFRYQLTPLGQFAQAFVAKKIENNRFVIKTDKPGVEVSWQVTGVRHDSFAKSHPIRVEEHKPLSLRQH